MAAAPWQRQSPWLGWRTAPIGVLWAFSGLLVVWTDPAERATALVMSVYGIYVVVSLLRSHADYQQRLDVDQDLRDQRDLFARQSRIDPLTELANRRHFAETLGLALGHAQATGEPLSLLLLDIDHFKKINDTHGHGRAAVVQLNRESGLACGAQPIGLDWPLAPQGHAPMRLDGNALTTLLVGIWLAYAIVLATWVVMQKKEPAATLAWVFSLLFLPVLGFFIFFFFGPRRIKRSTTRRKESYEAIRRAFAPESAQQEADSPHDLSIQLTLLVQTATGMPLSTCRSIELLVNGSPKFDAVIGDIKSATKHVHLEYYIYDGDKTGTLIRDALVEALGRGVQVRLLMDGAGSFNTTDEFLKPLKDAGAEIAVFHPVLRGIPHLRPLLNFRSHRKIAVIDGSIGFTGGINVTDDENDRINPDCYFRDLHTRLEGDAVHWMQRVFLEDWHYASGKTPPEDGLFPDSNPGKYAVQLIPSGPDNAAEPIHRAYLSAIHSADERVWLTTPYFVPTTPALYALTSAAMRGLDVRVMMPKKSDSHLVNLAARSYFDALLRAKVRVFQYQPRMLHSKSLLIDDSFAILGSANFDTRSLQTNFEMSIAVHEKEIASELERVWNVDQADCVEAKESDPKPSFLRRLGEASARLCAPLL